MILVTFPSWSLVISSLDTSTLDMLVFTVLVTEPRKCLPGELGNHLVK
jgi:hypothetical protein